MFEHPGGVAEVVLNLATGLEKRGHTVKIITSRPATYKGPIPEDYIVVGTVRNFSGGFGTKGSWGSAYNVAEIKRILEEEKFDVINFHEPWIPMIGMQFLLFSDAAHVGTFHANLMDTAAGKFWINTFYPIGRPYFKKFHILTAPSKVPAAMLIDKASDNEHHNFLVNNFRFIPNGINLAKFRPVKKRKPLSGPNTKTIVYVGRLEKRKGVDHLLEAFDLLVKEMPNAHLIIAGKGAKRKELEKIVKTNGTPNVKLLGFVTDEEKVDLFANADLVCAPAMFGESFGIVLVEAMATGAPVIGGANLGYKSVMTGYGRLGLVDAESTDDFANRLAVFLNEPSINNAMRQWGIQESKQYEYETVIKGYEEAYRAAIDRKKHMEAKKESKKNGRKITKIINRVGLRRHS